jgi:hypothetical protein
MAGYVAALNGKGTSVHRRPRGEPGGPKVARPLGIDDAGRVPITVPRDSDEYRRMIEVPSRYDVGAAKAMRCDRR